MNGTYELAIAIVIALLIAYGLGDLARDLVARILWVLRRPAKRGDLVIINGQAGDITNIGLTRLAMNLMDGGKTSVPLGAIGEVTVYPKGHQALLIDIILPPGNDHAKFVEGWVITRTAAMRGQFPSLIKGQPKIVGKRENNAGQQYIRVMFPVWPNAGAAVEKVFKPQIATALRRLDAEYADWMVAVSYDPDA